MYLIRRRVDREGITGGKKHPEGYALLHSLDYREFSGIEFDRKSLTMRAKRIARALEEARTIIQKQSRDQ